APFEKANIIALAGGFFLYNVDDIITLPAQVAEAASADNGVVSSHQPQLAAEQTKSGAVDR
ncbi:MAG: hypothetical protein OER85_09435, partial [Gammaproteobacteria bacterium]|nr:hypothetical protein [Gammaproteobacteria bacterium]